MECERENSEDEDLDLEALRLAALASLKSRAAKKSEESTEASENNTLGVPAPIIPYTPGPYLRKEQAPGSLPKTQYSWRNSAIQQRRGRGRGGFPKINQRSNLIVITPISTDGNKDSAEKAPVPQLSLPQHKWCQPINESSSSPKTYSRRGPTRFNRHESGSESSDSDYDDLSDHDSYSNETILQDENSVNFAQLTPEETVESESPLMTQRNSDRRLSFQNASLDSIQPAEVAANLTTTYPRSSIVDNTVSSTIIDSIDQGATNYYDYSLAPGTSYQSQMVSSVIVNGGSNINENFDSACRRLSDTAGESFPREVAKDFESCTVDSSLSQNDLRLELKKRMLKLRSENADLAKSEKLSQVRDGRQASDDVWSEYGRDRDRIHDHFRSDGTGDSRMRDRSRSPNRGRARSRSPANRERSRSRDRDYKRFERNPKRDYSRSPGRKRHRDTSRSPNKNGKRSWSRSPVKIHRRTSASPERDTKRDYSRSPKRDYSRSPERRGKRYCSPERSYKRDRSPDKSKKRDYSRSPSGSQKHHPSAQSPAQKKSSHSPCRSRKRSLTRSPDRTFKREDSPGRSHKHSETRSPGQNHKRVSSRSPDKSRRKLSPPSIERKHMCNTRKSPIRGQKRDWSQSPEKKLDGRKRDWSQSPEKKLDTRKHNWSRSPEKKTDTRKHDWSRSPENKQDTRKREWSQSPEKKLHTHRKDSSRSPEQKPGSQKHDRSRSLERKHRSNNNNLSRSPEKKSSHSLRSKSPVRSHRPYTSISPERSRGRNRNKNSRYRWSHSSRSSSSASSRSGSNSSSSHFSSPCVRSISSVVKPVQSSFTVVQSGVGSKDSDSDLPLALKKDKESDVKPKALSSLVKSSIVVGENRNNAPDIGKRLPVHMRLGSLSRNKLIRMAKDVEAAFVNTSSDEDGDAEGKKQNFRVVAEMDAGKSDVLTRHVERSPSKNSSVTDSKSRRKKTYR